MTEKGIHLTWLQPICFWKLPVYQQSQWTQAHLTRGFTLYIQQFRTSNFCTYLSLPTVCKLVVLHTHVNFSQIVWGAMTCPLLWDNYLHKNCCCKVIFLFFWNVHSCLGGNNADLYSLNTQRNTYHFLASVTTLTPDSWTCYCPPSILTRVEEMSTCRNTQQESPEKTENLWLIS